MRVIAIIAGVVLLGAALGGLFVWRVVSGVTEYHDTARAFLDSAMAGDGVAARALMAPQDAADWPPARLTGFFEGADPFVAIRFPSIDYDAANGVSRATITGVGETAAGCVSTLRFDFVNSSIVTFVVEPICGGGGIAL